jgi:DNA polymerase-4
MFLRIEVDDHDGSDSHHPPCGLGFYASVEQLLDPSLRGRPVAVGCGVVLAASYEANAFGVRGGMPGRRAWELCPQLVFVPGHFKEYQRLGDAAIKVLGDCASCTGR